jgi:protocatechuate 3,4-dioxygenase beta subunit
MREHGTTERTEAAVASIADARDPGAPALPFGAQLDVWQANGEGFYDVQDARA